jgi:hypothetical protein
LPRGDVSYTESRCHMRIRVLPRVILLCAAPALSLGQSFTLGGHVVNGLTNQSLPGIRVHLYELAVNDGEPLGSHGPAAAPVISDSEGHFIFTRLSRGQYVLQAELPREIYNYGESADPLRRNNTISVGPESEGQEVVFRVLPRASIEGIVRDEHREVPLGSGVHLYRRDRRGGRIELMPDGFTGTDDRGHYTFVDLWPGDYVVCAEPPQPWPANFAPAGTGEVEYRPGGDSLVYTESCYPDPKEKTSLLRLSPGAQQHLDLTLHSAPSITLRPNLNVALFLEDVPRLVPVNASETTGSASDLWQVRNVPPGNYILYTIASGDPDFSKDAGYSMRTPVTVTSQPPALQLVPEKRGRVDVRLHASNGGVLSSDAAAVSFFRFAELTLADRYAPAGLLNTFDAGDYWLSVRPKPPFCVASQTLTGGTLQNGKLTVIPGMSARLDVEVGTNCGAIDIRAISNGASVPFASFLLLVNGTPKEPGDVITGSVGVHGDASISRVPPGRYLLWAWVSNGDGYLGPDLADAAARAVDIVVAAGQTASISIDPMRPGVSR